MGMELTGEKVCGGETLEALLMKAKKKVKKVLCDGDYDGHGNFNFWQGEG